MISNLRTSLSQSSGSLNYVTLDSPELWQRKEKYIQVNSILRLKYNRNFFRLCCNSMVQSTRATSGRPSLWKGGNVNLYLYIKCYNSYKIVVIVVKLYFSFMIFLFSIFKFPGWHMGHWLLVCWDADWRPGLPGRLGHRPDIPHH